MTTRDPRIMLLGLEPVQINLFVNGESRSLEVEPGTTLVDCLRDTLGMRGTKVGCGRGQCGACTVLLNGQRRLSCITLAIMQDGAHLQTIEGVAEDGELHPLQHAFIELGAFQCGFCTPGQIMSGLGLLREGRTWSADEIREGMSGNLCRCAAYQNIVRAISEVAQSQAEGESSRFRQREELLSPAGAGR